MAERPTDRERIPRPRGGGGHWNSFVAEPRVADQAVRALHERDNPKHRLRVEHDDHTLLIHLSGEEGDGWTTIAVDRTTRRCAVGEDARQADSARDAYDGLYRD